ncbi:hypothetical protein ABMA27_012506 [Loxostege sticticalis]|uniref:Tick transposon n=1 Tax=Loxostege sticticalis TaxID=481309 RepID=A0ABR3GYU4_LOXSC
MNIRSINKNLDQFTVMLSTTRLDFDILILSECRIKKFSKVPQLAGYSSFHTENNRLQNDGVVIYAKLGMNVSVWEPRFTDGNCLVCTAGDKFAFIGIYRSPSYSNIDAFLSCLNNLVLSLKAFKNISLLGDINIDIKANNTDSRSSHYLTSTAALGLLPAHTYPTHLGNCIDHVLLKTNLPSKVMVLDNLITDHSPTILCLETGSHVNPKSHKTIIRTDYESIKNALNDADYSTVMCTFDADQAADRLISIVSSTVNAYTKTVETSRRKNILKPWITLGLLRCMRNRDKMHMKLRKDPGNQILKVTYKRYRNFLNNLLNRLKCDHQTAEFNKAKNSPKAMWNNLHMNSWLNIPIHTMPLTRLTNFLSIIARNLAAKITPPVTNSSLATDNQANSLVLTEVDYGEVERIICGLRDDCSPGWDKISATILKASKNALIPPITHMCYLSISTGVFPKVLKRALVSPIFKQGDRSDVADYRPTSCCPRLRPRRLLFLYILQELCIFPG